MNKSDVVKALMGACHLSRRRAEGVVDTILETMSNALARGQRIEIRNFGRFITKAYSSRPGRNPRTGEAVEVAAKRLTHFKPGKELKERIEKKGSD